MRVVSPVTSTSGHRLLKISIPTLIHTQLRERKWLSCSEMEILMPLVLQKVLRLHPRELLPRDPELRPAGPLRQADQPRPLASLQRLSTSLRGPSSAPCRCSPALATFPRCLTTSDSLTNSSAAPILKEMCWERRLSSRTSTWTATKDGRRPRATCSRSTSPATTTTAPGTAGTAAVITGVLSTLRGMTFLTTAGGIHTGTCLRTSEGVDKAAEEPFAIV